MASKSGKSKKGPFILTKDVLMASIPDKSPKAAELLAEYGLHCIGCFANQFDTVETGSQTHGMSEEDMQDMLKEINEELRSSKKLYL